MLSVGADTSVSGAGPGSTQDRWSERKDGHGVGGGQGQLVLCDRAGTHGSHWNQVPPHHPWPPALLLGGTLPVARLARGPGLGKQTRRLSRI